MYNQRVKLEFLEIAPLSARFRFLAELAGDLEKAGKPSQHSPGFSIDIKDHTQVQVDVWQPGKYQALLPKLRAGIADKLLLVTYPSNCLNESGNGES